MSSDLDKARQTERMMRFQSISAGLYWRALCDIPHYAITKGMVLLIESIRWVDDAPHTIIVRAHPLNYGKNIAVTMTRDDGSTVQRHITCTTHRFLTEDFLEKFEFEPDHEPIRQQEAARVQEEITGLQMELAQAQTDPAILSAVIEDEMRKDAEKTSTDVQSDTPTNLPALPDDALAKAAHGSLPEIIGTGITEAMVGALKGAAQQQHKVATIKAKWLENKTGEIASKIQALTPFYQEQAAAALARTEDVREYVSKLMKGIESLDLYTGKDVYVETIATGKSAPKSEPLTCVQRKLMMEEELAIWQDVDESFDHNSQEHFYEALREHPDLVDQVFPAQRCVVLMATTRRMIDYGDPLTSNVHNRENRMVCLMVRDGENIYRVLSSVETHLGAGRLFPSRDENDRIFRGFDGSRITLNDIAYTDRLAAHESAVLHYKRFLILLCGLDHRLGLFGPFYDGPQDLSFVTAKFQEDHLRFVHDEDGEGMLPEEDRLDFKTYIASLNAAMQSGSRVLCIWSDLMNPTTAPSTCSVYGVGSGRSYDWNYRPAEDHGICIVQRSGQDLFVKVHVSGENRRWEQREFDAKVQLTKRARNGYYDEKWATSGLPFLCLDLADPDKLEWYIKNRKTRQYHLAYIKTFKRAVAALRAEKAAQGATRARMLDALTSNQITTRKQGEDIVNRAIAAWRASNRGADLPDFAAGKGNASKWKALLDQMYLLAGAGEDRAKAIEEFAAERDLTPLRVSLTGNGSMALYAAPSAAERDDRLEPFVWVHRLLMKPSGSGMTVTSQRWALMRKAPADETIIRQFPEAAAWIDLTSAFNSPKHKAEAFTRTERFETRIAAFAPGSTALRTEFERWTELRDRMLEGSKTVVNPVAAIPLGIELNRDGVHYICAYTSSPIAMIYRVADDELRAEIRAEFIGCYRKKSAGNNVLDREIEGERWAITSKPIADFTSDDEAVYFDRDEWNATRAGDAFDPRLTSALDSYMKRAKTEDVWIPESHTDQATGALHADRALGLYLPEGYAPVTVREITIYEQDKNGVLAQWWDIAPASEKNDAFDQIDRAKLSINVRSMSASTSGYINLEAAIEDLTKKATRNGRILKSEEVPVDLPPPPEHITRIYYTQRDQSQ